MIFTHRVWIYALVHIPVDVVATSALAAIDEAEKQVDLSELRITLPGKSAYLDAAYSEWVDSYLVDELECDGTTVTQSFNFDGDKKPS